MDKPCIIFLNERIPAPFLEGGSQISTHIILTELFKKGYSVYSVGIVGSYLRGIVHDYPSRFDQIPTELEKFSIPYTYSETRKCIKYSYPYNIEIHDTLNLEDFYRDLRKRHKKITLMTQTRLSEDVLPFAIKENIPTLLFIRDHLRVNSVGTIKLLKKSYSNIHIIFNSKYTATKYEDIKKIFKTTVIYPPIDLSYYKIHTHEPQYITMVNPVIYKGGKIFLDLVKRFPNQKFLAVNGWYKPENDGLNFNNYSNLTTWERRQDIKDVFKVTKILLIPSQWEEAFGRIGAEALIAGIPIIASHQGGLLESLDHSCFYVNDYTSEEAWCDTLNQVLSNKDNLSMYKDKGMKYAKKFCVDAAIEKIVKLLEKIYE